MSTKIVLTTRPQRFRDFADFQRVVGFLVPRIKGIKAAPWRLTEQLLGGSRGLPNIRGWLSATNGTEAILYDEQNGELYKIILSNFVPDVDIFEIQCTDGSKVKIQQEKKKSAVITSIVNDLLS